MRIYRRGALIPQRIGYLLQGFALGAHGAGKLGTAIKVGISLPKRTKRHTLARGNKVKSRGKPQNVGVVLILVRKVVALNHTQVAQVVALGVGA